ncbi:enoyl-CoA hydratase-related protein [Mesorhizobium sp. M0700]|uniref:enoyl-CoA hydratase-related protein n=1 Tax=Mesorhizobium sp. M0700 TaxID=2956988 RepID=UPI00333BC74A
MNRDVRVKTDGAIMEITFARPPVNAISRAASGELFEAFREFNNDDKLLVAIITGDGSRVFSAGWDLKEYAASSDKPFTGDFDLGPGGLGGFTEFWDLKKPVIAAVNGSAVGGGFEMAMAADIVIAAEHVEFWLPEMELGFVPDAGAVQRLPKLLPTNVAADLLFTGRRMSATEAKQWGFVRDVTSTAQLMPKAYEIANVIASGAPLALQALKECLAEMSALSVRESFAKTHAGWKGEAGMPIFEKTIRSEDFKEGPRAFAEKRRPVWQGR